MSTKYESLNLCSSSAENLFVQYEINKFKSLYKYIKANYYLDFEETENLFTILDKLRFLKHLSALNTKTNKNNIIKNIKICLSQKLKDLVILQQVNLKF